jgi:hypothetical protein
MEGEQGELGQELEAVVVEQSELEQGIVELEEMVT